MQINDDFRAYFQMNPNQVVVRGRKQHVQVTSRDGEVHEFMLQDAAQVAGLCADLERDHVNCRVRLRRFWGDNSKGNARAEVQVILPQRDNSSDLDPKAFQWPSTTANGQNLAVEVEVWEKNLGSDHFEANAEEFYREE